jgi:hypothetical protein
MSELLGQHRRDSSRDTPEGRRREGRYGLWTPDAVIVATRILQGATRVISNDRPWKRLEGIDVVCLSDYCE